MIRKKIARAPQGAPDGVTVALPKSKAACGAWVNDARGDGCVTVYAKKDQGVVIGLYRSLGDEAQECDLALAVGPDGKIFVQYREGQELKFKGVTPAAYRALLAGMLETAKNLEG